MKENRFSCPKCNFWLNSAQMRRRGNPYFQCPSCGELSPHKDWYHYPEGSEERETRPVEETIEDGV